MLNPTPIPSLPAELPDSAYAAAVTFIAIGVFALIITFAILLIKSLNRPDDLGDLQRRINAGRQLGAPTDSQASNTKRLENRLGRRTSRRVIGPAGGSSNARFYGPKDDR